jgi:flagellar biogenesis protein FliO
MAREIKVLVVFGVVVACVTLGSLEAFAELPTSLTPESTSVVGSSTESYSFAGSFVRMIGGFLLCLGVFAGGIHLYRRFGAVALRGVSRRLTVIERIPITAKSAVALVSLDGREFLVTSGPDNLRVVPTQSIGKESFDESLELACHDSEVCDA